MRCIPRGTGPLRRIADMENAVHSPRNWAATAHRGHGECGAFPEELGRYGASRTWRTRCILRGTGPLRRIADMENAVHSPRNWAATAHREHGECGAFSEELGRYGPVPLVVLPQAELGRLDPFGRAIVVLDQGPNEKGVGFLDVCQA